jgi:hypothetical protein
MRQASDGAAYPAKTAEIKWRSHLAGPGAARITNEASGPVSIHCQALSHRTGEVTGRTLGSSSPLILRFVHDLEQNTAEVVATQGKVLGPLNTSDFSSALLQARASGPR